LATPSIEVEPLASLSEAAAGLLADQAAGGVAVIAPSSGRTYGIRANDQFPLASVAKVLIMLTLLDEEMRQDQSPDGDQMELLRSMITTSDNDSADELWSEIGGGAAVERYLESMGVNGFSMNDDDDWGHSTASPLAVATLLLKLATGAALDRNRRDIAVGLLSEVEPDQRWGVSVAFPDSATIGIKDGWYPDDAGWWVNSAGVDWSSASPMVMVVMLGDQPSFDDGVAAIESTATLVADAIHANAAAGKP
jgi:beta-lactamase class A